MSLLNGTTLIKCIHIQKLVLWSMYALSKTNRKENSYKNVAEKSNKGNPFRDE